MNIQELRELWFKSYNENKDYVDSRVAEGIEKNRKSACCLRFTDESGTPLAVKKVRLTQKKHDFKYGANIFMLDEFEKEEDNKEYRRFFKEHFNLATVPFYWNTLEPEEGKPRFSTDSPKIHRRPSPDLCFDYCEENGILPKLHCLVYEPYTPDWLKHRSLNEIKAKYEERFRQISERYSGRLYEIEVINEVFNLQFFEDRSALSKQRDLVEWSFETARKYFPNEVLMINEGNPIQKLAREDWRAHYFLTVENALLHGAEIDKIGLQNHQFIGVNAKTPEMYEKDFSNHVRMELNDVMSYFKGLDVISELGLPLELTEVTIPTLGEGLEAEELQADVLRLWYSIWFSHPSVDGIVYWNTVDGCAHVVDDGKRYWNENNCQAGLWHHDLTPKKSAEMLKKLFTKEWHTEAELVTDENGYVNLRGFYGEYEAEIDGHICDFEIHKNDNNEWKFMI